MREFIPQNYTVMQEKTFRDKGILEDPNKKPGKSLSKVVHTDLKIAFSTFAELAPKNYILVGQSGTHSVLVWTSYQNVKLMIKNAS